VFGILTHGTKARQRFFWLFASRFTRHQPE
jgi:hypothetical protein